ncbi:MAG: type II secretion system F family protein [Dehalococcoidales bacterium]|nr:type II secretion system F family protein [Dehalococcoidales bacterium]
MLYQYVACNEAGEIVRGKISANSEEAINQMLGYAGYRLINLKPYVPFMSMDSLTARLFPIKPNDVILLFRQLALLIESGISVVAGLELLRDQTAKPSLKKVLSEVIADVRGGSQLSRAMSRHPEVFSPVNCRTLSIGEQTGNLETMLRQMADHMERDASTRKSIKGALMYPAIAGVVTVIVVCVLLFFVLPAFASLYSSLGAQLPTLTRMLIELSNVLRKYAMHIFMGIAIIIGLVVIYLRTPDGKYRLDVLMLKLPLIGKINLLNELSRCCRGISLLFSAGLPLTEIMPLVVQSCNNRVIAQGLHEVETGMLRGEGIARPMSQNTVFLPMMVQMIKVGEETGNLETSLQAIAQNFEIEASEKTKTLIGLIPPVMTILIAGFVGLIALSMVSAMYSIYGQAF